MREFKGDWKDLFNGFVLALDFRKMLLGFMGILTTLLACWVITFKWARRIAGDDGATVPANWAPKEFWDSLTSAWFTIYHAGWNGVAYTIVVLPIFIIIWGLFGGAIARIAAYEIARDGERIETAKAFRFAWSKFNSFFWAPMICILGFLFFFLCNVLGGALTGALDLLIIGGPIGAFLMPMALLSGFIMVLLAIGSFVGAPLFLPAVAAEGTDSFDAMSRGFSYVYSRPWHFAWYQIVAGAYGWVCIAFVTVFTVVMCYLGIYACGSGFDWVEKLWYGAIVTPKDDDRQNLFGTAVRDGIAKANKDNLPKWSAVRVAKEGEDPAAHEARINEALANGDLLKKAALRAILEANKDDLADLKNHWVAVYVVDEGLGLVIRSGRGVPSAGDRRLHCVNQKAWDLLLSRKHTSTSLYAWGPRDLVTEPHPYGRLMFLLNCSITWDGRTVAGDRHVGVDRAIADRTMDELGWGGEIMVTYWIVVGWLVLALGLAYGYAVSYFISQQTVIYFLLRKKVDGIEMNEVFEEPEEQEPLPEITRAGEGDKAPEVKV